MDGCARAAPPTQQKEREGGSPLGEGLVEKSMSGGGPVFLSPLLLLPRGSWFCNSQSHPWHRLLGFQGIVLYVTFSLPAQLMENHILLCEKCSVLDCQSSIQLEKIYVRHSFIFHVFCALLGMKK